MCNLKRFSAFMLALVLAVFAFTGCETKYNTPKEFSREGMTITLNEEFNEGHLDEATAYYQGMTSILIVEKFKFEDLKSENLSSDSTIEDFAGYITDYYSLGEESEFILGDNGEYLYTDYVRTIRNETYTFVPCLFKSGDAFWVFDFCCSEIHALSITPDFHKWASTIKFD